MQTFEMRAAKPVTPRVDRIGERSKASVRTLPLLEGLLPVEAEIAEPDPEDAEPDGSEATSLH